MTNNNKGIRVLLRGAVIVLFNIINVEGTLAQAPGIWQGGGPAGQTVGMLLSDPVESQILYAITGDGIYKSTNNGLNWIQASAPMDSGYINGSAFAHGILYAIELNTGIYRSTDGLNWVQVRPSSGVIDFYETILSVGNTLYVGRLNGGILRSTDGLNWTEVGPSSVTDLYYHKGILYAKTTSSVSGLYISTDGISWIPADPLIKDKSINTFITFADFLYAGGKGIFRSSDGVNWTQLNLNLPFAVYVYELISANGKLYAYAGSSTSGMPFHGILLSNDGITWIKANPPMDNVTIVSFVAKDGILYVSTYDGLYRSINGLDWEKVNSRITEFGYVTCFLIKNGQILAGTSGGGVFRSLDGLDWIESNNGMLKVFGPRVIAIDSLNPNIIYAGTGLGFYRSTDGLAWQYVNNLRVTQLLTRPGFVFAGTASSGIFRSNDGINWLHANSPLDSGTVTLLAFINGAFYASREYGYNPSTNILYRSPDGINWTQTNLQAQSTSIRNLISANQMLYATIVTGVYYSHDGLNWNWASSLRGQVLYFLFFVNNTFYAGTDFGLYRSTDAKNWTLADPLFNLLSAHYIVSNNGVLYVTTSSIFNNEQAIYRSTDGLNWVKVFQVHVRFDVGFSALISGNGTVYAAVLRGVYKSENGINWFRINSGLPGEPIWDLTYLASRDILYATTDYGLFFQQVDKTAPIAQSIIINDGGAYTNKPTVNLELRASGVTVGLDSVIISEDSSFAGVYWQPYLKNLPFILSYGDSLKPPPSGDGLKRIFVKIKDISWNESQIINSQITLDTKPPLFFPHTPPGNAILGKPVIIRQQVYELNLQSLNLHFRLGGSAKRDERIVSFRGDTARVDSMYITNKGIDYRIMALDSARNEATLQNGALEFFSLPLEISVDSLGSSPGLPSGTGGAAYRIVSLPLKLSSTPTVTSVFGNQGEYGSEGDWRFWTYQGNGQWNEGTNIPIQNGQGYFLILRNGGNLTNKVSGTTMETTSGVLGTIPGWHLRANDWTIIGNPYNTKIELSQLKLSHRGLRLNAPDTSFQVWAYDGRNTNKGWTRENISLEPWYGLAIRVTAADTIVFANKSDPYARDLTKSQSTSFFDMTANRQANEWIVQVQAEGQDYSDNANYFGVRQGASEEQDVYDWYEPPILPGGISVSFPHPEWRNSASFASDIRPITKQGYKWELKVKANGGTAANLSFDYLETVPKKFDVFLLDEKNRILRDLRKQPQVAIRIPHETDTKNVTIFVGNHDFVNDHTDGLSATPQSFALHQNYPNPFNPATVIRYELPVAGTVTLKIYNLLGTEVATLENKEPRETGFYEKVVDLSNFASGIYFYRISVSGEKRFEATKKLVLAK